MAAEVDIRFEPPADEHPGDERGENRDVDVGVDAEVDRSKAGEGTRRAGQGQCAGGPGQVERVDAQSAFAEAEADRFGVREGDLAEFDEEAGDLPVDFEGRRCREVPGGEDAAFDGGPEGGGRLRPWEVLGRAQAEVVPGKRDLDCSAVGLGFEFEGRGEQRSGPEVGHRQGERAARGGEFALRVEVECRPAGETEAGRQEGPEHLEAESFGVEVRGDRSVLEVGAASPRKGPIFRLDEDIVQVEAGRAVGPAESQERKAVPGRSERSPLRGEGGGEAARAGRDFGPAGEKSFRVLLPGFGEKGGDLGQVDVVELEGE